MDDALARQFGQLQFGDHLGLIYEDVTESFGVTAHFIALGLARGMRCLGITSDHPIDPFVTSLAAAGVDVAREQARRSLELRPSLIQTDASDPEAMVAALEREVTNAIAGGYPGLCVVGEAGPAHGGRLEVTSRPGRGTRVRLAVPLPPPEEASG